MSVRCLDCRWKWRVALFMVLLNLRFSGAAQEDLLAPALPSKANEIVYSLTGTVINSATGEPVRRAAVQIAGQAGGATLTDDAGHFLFGGLGEGQFFVTAIKPGFYENEPGAGQIAVGRDTAPAILKLTPCGAIVGRVTTRDGRALEGFRISLITKEMISGRATWVERGNQGITNEDGEFRLAGLQAGNYYLAVDAGQQTSLGERGVVNAREQGYARVLYPGVSDLSSASPIEVISGRETETNFSLVAEPLYQVSGVVTQAVTGLQFGRRAGSDDDFTLMANVQDGKFQAKLPAGSYVVTGPTAEGVSLSTPGPSVVVTADNADLHIPLAATASIPVRIQMEHAGSGAGQRISPEQLPGIRIDIESTSHVARMMRWWNPRSGGIDDVAPGTYTLHVHTGLGSWVKSAQCGGVDLLSDDFTVVDAGSPMPIEITLRDDAGLVTGTVAGAGQWSQVMVLLVDARGKKSQVEATGAVVGSFSFQGVAPGDYSVVAIDRGDLVEYANPDVLNLYLPSAQPIHVSAHGTATVNLTVIPRR